ncbi:hypothetical protein ISN45_At05g012720 [Arabidopsis thaliana x Arabidopsis arenosa]|uniref:Aminopeptidase n=1 Tax=Arabidopsis thaliana x Arabidopsis arenosa TaxID=1240361 RepID=A0A8T2CRR5_9BRAS|nr:hypothetical protein ISN45_At05g012720 [Arabidopsis thaliana x Arabidopsis arenosa]
MTYPFITNLPRLSLIGGYWRAIFNALFGLSVNFWMKISMRFLLGNWPLMSSIIVYCILCLHETAYSEIFALWANSPRRYGGLGIFFFQVFVYPLAKRLLGPVLVTHFAEALMSDDTNTSGLSIIANLSNLSLSLMLSCPSILLNVLSYRTDPSSLCVYRISYGVPRPECDSPGLSSSQVQAISNHVSKVKSDKVIDYIKREYNIKDKWEREEFLRFCQRVECTIRAWYHLHFEDLMQLYSLFEPVRGAHRLNQQNLSTREIDALEDQFLLHLFQVMEKSNFKVITNEEIQVALSAQYRLNLPIVVNEAKLDTKLLTRYFSKFPRDDLPHFADKYIIFRRGFGIDHMKAYFFLAKIDTILVRIWHFLLTITCLKRLVYGKKIDVGLSEQIDISIETEKDSLYIERIRIEKLKLSLSNLMKKITIQEPTFERIIVVYRRVSGKKESERNIYVKHFKTIPMADMEIVLPEKKNPGLTPLDWVKFLVSAAIGLVTVVSSVSLKKADIRVIAAILSTVVAYCVKTYFTFQRNLVDYQSLITRSVYDKQLDSGRGTLLHLCDEVIQQEVKEVIISFFMLIKKGCPTSKEELDMKSEAFIKEEFNESCNFDVDDAITKLEKLGLVSRDSEDKYRCVEMKEANEIMGTTTEEMVLKARQGGEYEDEDTTATEPQMNPQDELTAKEERFQSRYDEFETLWM